MLLYIIFEDANIIQIELLQQQFQLNHYYIELNQTNGVATLIFRLDDISPSVVIVRRALPRQEYIILINLNKLCSCR